MHQSITLALVALIYQVAYKAVPEILAVAWLLKELSHTHMIKVKQKTSLILRVRGKKKEEQGATEGGHPKSQPVLPRHCLGCSDQLSQSTMKGVVCVNFLQLTLLAKAA